MNESSGVDWPLAFFLVGMFACIAFTIVAVVAVIGASWRSRASVDREAAYKQLAQECVLAAGRTAEQLAAANEQLAKATGEISDLRARTAELERMLKDV